VSVWLCAEDERWDVDSGMEGSGYGIRDIFVAFV